MALINQKKIILDTSGIESKLDRLNYLLEQFMLANNVPINGVPDYLEQVDLDDYSSVLYTDEEQIMVEEQVAKRVGGMKVE